MRRTDPIGRGFAGIVRRPKTVLAVFLVFAAALGWQARRFEIDASPDTLLTPGNEDYIRMLVANERFDPEEFLIVAYEPESHPLFSQRTFNDLRELSRRIGELERVAEVRSILNVPIFSQAEGELTPDTDFSQLTVEKQAYSPEQLKREFEDHPIYEDLLINARQTATGLQVVFEGLAPLDALQTRITALERKRLERELSEQERSELERLREESEPLEQQLQARRQEEIVALRSIAAEFEDRAHVYLGGVSVLAKQLVDIIRNDLIVFGAAIAIGICLLLLLLFRRPRWVLITALSCACSVTSTMGLLGMLGLRATVISSSFVALQLILTLAIVVHLIVQYRERAASDTGRDQAGLVQDTMMQKAAPCFFAGVTTSVGFASLVFSDIQPVISFGWMMIVAMGFSLAVSLVLFPALMMLFPREDPQRRGRLATLSLNALARVSTRHRAPVIAIFALALAVSVAGALRLDVENSFIDYFREDTRVHQELRFVDQQFGGSTPLDLIYTIPDAAKSPDLVLTAETVQQMQRIQQRLEAHEAIGKVLSVVNFTALAKQLNQDRPLTEYELSALYYVLDESLRDALFGSFYSPDTHQLRLSLRIEDTTPGLRRGALLESIRQDLLDLGVPDDAFQLTNAFVLYQSVLEQLYASQILTLGIVFGALFAVLCVLFRSLKLGLVTLAPNVIATLGILGLMGWLRLPLDLMTITIAAIAMGIASDDTIHYTHRYLDELRHHEPEMAAERSFHSVGYAMLYTSFIISMGFALLIFSDFVPSIYFGLLTATAMGLALITDLTLLPALLTWVVRNRAPVPGSTPIAAGASAVRRA